MITARQAQRDARRLFRLCVVDGAVDETRARGVVQRMVEAARPSTMAVLSRFQRLVRIDRAKHRAIVVSAAPLPDEVRSELEAGVLRLYGGQIVTSFAEDPTLIGGVRITVGSDVYDGTVKARLETLAASFITARADRSGSAA